jgi:hypothetical protein
LLPDDPLPPPEEDAVASGELPPELPPLLLPKAFDGRVLFEPQAAAVTIAAKPMPAANETRRKETGDAWGMGNSERWRLMWGGV